MQVLEILCKIAMSVIGIIACVCLFYMCSGCASLVIHVDKTDEAQACDEMERECLYLAASIDETQDLGKIATRQERYAQCFAEWQVSCEELQQMDGGTDGGQ